MMESDCQDSVWSLSRAGGGSARRLGVGLKWVGNLRDCGPWDAGTSDVSGCAVLMVAETERSWETSCQAEMRERFRSHWTDGVFFNFSDKPSI